MCHEYFLSRVIRWKNISHHFSWSCLSNIFDASLTLLNFNYGTFSFANSRIYTVYPLVFVLGKREPFTILLVASPKYR